VRIQQTHSSLQLFTCLNLPSLCLHDNPAFIDGLAAARQAGATKSRGGTMPPAFLQGRSHHAENMSRMTCHDHTTASLGSLYAMRCDQACEHQASGGGSVRRCRRIRRRGEQGVDQHPRFRRADRRAESLPRRSTEPSKQAPRLTAIRGRKPATS
jgi:hypothetical protein